MIVDDEPDTLFTYEWFLSDEGYNVEAFTDPQEALKRFVHIRGFFLLSASTFGHKDAQIKWASAIQYDKSNESECQDYVLFRS